jgi:helix-turn-helix protein
MSLPPFSMVPTIAWGDVRLLESDLRVLGALCSFWNRDKAAAWPSHADIARRACVSRRTIVSSLARLKRFGYVEWDEQYASSGARIPNVYYVVALNDGFGLDPSESLVAQGSEAQGSQGGEEQASQPGEAKGDTALRNVGFTQTDQPTDQESDQGTDLQTSRKRSCADERTAKEKQAFYLEQIAREEAKVSADAS